MTSNQSKGFDDVTWLGGVLGLPLELKRLALRDWYLAPVNRFRNLLDMLSIHVIYPGVTLPPISLVEFDRHSILSVRKAKLCCQLSFRTFAFFNMWGNHTPAKQSNCVAMRCMLSNPYFT
jgi:hypothetical protein